MCKDCKTNLDFFDNHLSIFANSRLQTKLVRSMFAYEPNISDVNAPALVVKLVDTAGSKSAD